MGWFGFGKEREVIDLSERYRKLKEKKLSESEALDDKPENPVSEGFGFLASLGKSSRVQEKEPDFVPAQEDSEERKRKLAKRLAEMTNRIEEMSNQIYHLQQRVEVLERKVGVRGFE